MTFPESERVIYDRNPLVEVICQLRFPPLLRIDAEVPARFQEAIREQFPLFDEAQPLQAPIQLPGEIARQLPPAVAKAAAQQFAAQFRVSAGVAGKTYRFLSEDEAWTVTITREWLALSTNRYVRWERFKASLIRVVAAFRDIYAPAFYSRIGLRYQNVLCRSSAGLSVDAPWSSLLQPQLAGILGSEIAEKVTALGNVTSITLDEGELTLRHGLATSDDDPEVCYSIDGDFYLAQRVELDDAERILDNFNREAARLFRWCITPDLHRALGPRPVPDDAHSDRS